MGSTSHLQSEDLYRIAEQTELSRSPMPPSGYAPLRDKGGARTERCTPATIILVRAPTIWKSRGKQLNNADTKSDDLPRRMADWDLQAFRDFNIDYGRRFAAFFRRRGLSQAEAEDLAATCVTDIAIRVPQFVERAEGNLQRWVWTLARGALADWWRKHRPHQSLSVDFAAPEGDPDEEAVQALHEALGQMPQRDREILELRDLSTEPKYDEIASRLGITKGAAKARHRRAVERLKTVLEQDTRIQVFLERTKSRRPAAGKNDRQK